MYKYFVIIALCSICISQVVAQLELPPDRIISREQWAEVRRNFPDADSAVLISLTKRVEILPDTLILLKPCQITFTAIDSTLWERVDSVFFYRWLQDMPARQAERSRFLFLESVKAAIIVNIMKYDIDKEPPILLESWIDICPVQGPAHSSFWGPPPIDVETGQIIFPPPP